MAKQKYDFVPLHNSKLHRITVIHNLTTIDNTWKLSLPLTAAHFSAQISSFFSNLKISGGVGARARCLSPCYGPEDWVKSNRLSTCIERLETTLICAQNDFLFPFRKSIGPTWVITNLFTIQKKKSWCIDGDILHSLFMVWPFLFSSKYWFSVVNTQLFGIEQDFSGNSWKPMDANWAFSQFLQTFFPISAVSLRIFLTAFWFVIFRHRRSVLWTGFQNCDP